LLVSISGLFYCRLVLSKAMVFDKNLQQQHRTGPTKLQGP
jgi:hypothetical protein